MLEMIEGLVRTPSVSSVDPAMDQGNRAVIDLLAGWLDDSGFQVEDRTSRFILPTRAYRFLPSFLIRFLATVEPVVPDNRRVLSYWKARKV